MYCPITAGFVQLVVSNIIYDWWRVKCWCPCYPPPSAAHPASVTPRRKSGTGQRASPYPQTEPKAPPLWPSAGALRPNQRKSAELREKQKASVTVSVRQTCCSNADVPDLMEPVQVVQLPVLPAPIMHYVFGHGLLRPAEHGRLVHVVPHKQRFRGALMCHGERKYIQLEFRKTFCGWMTRKNQGPSNLILY